MAIAGDLICAVSDLVGLTDQAVAWQYRLLREAGMVSKAGRGRSAARMTPGDAAALLIAVLGEMPDPADRRLGVWEEYAFARCEGEPFSLAGGYLPRLAALKKGHTLLQALEALIDDAAVAEEGVRVMIAFVPRLAYATIHVSLREMDVEPSSAGLSSAADRRYLTTRAQPDKAEGLYSIRSISLPALRVLGACVAGVGTEHHA